MHPSPDQSKQRDLAWSLYLVTGQLQNINKAAHSQHIPRSTARALRNVSAALQAAEWEIRGELAQMVRRSLKGL